MTSSFKFWEIKCELELDQTFWLKVKADRQITELGIYLEFEKIFPC